MVHKVYIHPENISFEIKPSQTVLEAAIAAGINIPFGCRNGGCGSCKGKVISGEVFCEEYQQSAMTHEEKTNGSTLCCQCYVSSDVHLEIKLNKANDPMHESKITPVRVESLTKLNHDVMKMLLKLPGNNTLKFTAGQYLEFIMADGSRRAFSIASAPYQELIELHLRLIDGGKFTKFVFEEMQEKSIHRIEAPIGQFYLRESEKPIIFISGGTGFAPIKSVIEDMIHHNNKRTIYLYQGVRSQKDLYMDDLCLTWQKEHENIHYIPVFSEPEKNDNQDIRTGFVHQAVVDDFESFEGYQAYSCGAPVVVQTAFKALVEKGLYEEEFFADAFTFAPPKK
ncbi:CDP-6-deoxy-delta-3,4-glucoseen reductase [Methylophilaceae bacterium]|jgi:CDP-4-dehydro-6-deoxyglucose reductase, E3|nr:CDP-6-deoxy-delta-3,4-glucoseen reductase [Betaproteobacteria bacterium]MCH9842506.1 CDP-6-deoxy-delta-3,4-glucoseen reductase [Betaproteobacteria bacterium]MDC1113846.1 CDP-6-deoxy-delta-3,4-glucoseen reductase [Methylophilaceae bacterium]|tara:strand:+ start:7344 stop:8360 length:1017 start_codon:yes stop_codon:yes gene_type:complete